ncbi:unnamed protein product [Triticum turgidum subsp. durum]|uniref:non-specific serine/threonine protein kinase n=1 Tax=Triticum turgidum subsp. durum TaxID=4567 RepID=A0A9R0VB08_TRITD|nr:unnamed protein product [Triticum turgidum subsp. durum]
MAVRWLLLLFVGLAGGGVHGQVDNLGFVSIDCGLPENVVGYVDNGTELRYVSDMGFIDTGTNHNLSAEYIKPSIGKIWHTVRSFAGGSVGARSCYTVRSLVSGLKYLIRAGFIYGNYDGLNRLPVFDLHIGVNYWQTINISVAGVMAEIITVVPGDSIQVCLVNTGSGTPFISSLDVRPLENKFYPHADESQGLVLVSRTNFGASDTTFVRYPEDKFDRIWSPWSNSTIWSVISTTEKVQKSATNGNDTFEPPLPVMQTAITPINSSSPIDFTWDAQASTTNNPNPGYVWMLYFAELQPTGVRQFDISLNGKPWLMNGSCTPNNLSTTILYSTKPVYASNQYNISLDATVNSTLPPIINAAEIYSVIPTTSIATTTQEVSAISAIRDKYHVKKNWMGDPCAPKNFVWNGLRCSYAASSPSTVTGLNLSSSGLSGNVSSSLASIRGLQYLDLSHNNLTGSIPESLSQLSSLVFLDITSNQLSGSIPSALLKRSQDGSLTLKYGNNPNLCGNGNSCQPPKNKSSSKVVVYVLTPIVVVFVIVLSSVMFLCMRRRMQGTTSNHVKAQNEANITPLHSQNNNEHDSLRLDNRRFKYDELVAVTNGFQRVIGRGGFGKVYAGCLEDGTQVAVKLRSESSDQGVQEFLAEAQTLAKIHHKNLVSLIGYCKDREYMALVYEYMSEGALHEHLRRRENNARCLTWRQSLRIALQSAQGLEYLHKGCNPPLIHRDVKTSNILLNANLEAKIADFGLLKAFNSNNDTHVSTARVVGTRGYLAPEYLTTFQLTNKSDVFSFGVVLLEIITGQPHILNDPEPTSIVQWVRQRLAHGNIETVVDVRIHNDHDVNSVWKATETALKCTAQLPEQRPTMTDVVLQLQECLKLEATRKDVNA